MVGLIRKENIHCCASFRTQEKEYGRPIKGLHKPRWFDEKRDPNQLWLPFKEFTPVQMYPPTQGAPNKWYCEFKVDAGLNYQASINTNRYRVERDTLLALEVYRRVEVEEPCGPFSATQAGYFAQSLSPQEYRMALSTVRCDRELRSYVEAEVARLSGSDCVILAIDGTFLDGEYGTFVAKFHSVETNITSQRSEYRVNVNFPYAPYVFCWSRSNMITSIREASDAFIRDMRQQNNLAMSAIEAADSYHQIQESMRNYG
jgi:hypothetical protein